MSGHPLVSVVIIFFNAQRFLREAIESVFSQTYPDWELLLVDDGSTDGGAGIAREVAARCPDKVRYIEHPGHQNRGMSATRNAGIAAARGEYIALLDADDVWLPHKLERQVALMESHPDAGLIYGSPLYWHGWTGKDEDRKRDHFPGVSVSPGTLVPPPQLMIDSYPLGAGPAPCPCDLMFRRALAEEVGGFEESFTGKYQLYEDQAFLAKVYLKSPVYVSGECWSRYRRHADSCMATVTEAGEYDTVRLYFLDWLSRYLRQEQVSSRAVRRALRAAYWPYRHKFLSQAGEILGRARKSLQARVARGIGQAR